MKILNKIINFWYETLIKVELLERYDGDQTKSERWLMMNNPLFGYLSGYDMIKMGRAKKAYQVIKDAKNGWIS